MGLPHMTSFCCCLGLEMGSKLIGFGHLAGAIAIIMVCSIFAEGARSMMGTVEDDNLLYTKWYKISVTVAVLSSTHVVLALILLYSAFKRITRGLRLWVLVMSILYVVALLYIVVSMCMSGLSGSGSDIFLSFLEGLLAFSTLAYCILCVHSYFLMLRSSEDMQGPDKTYY